jgi:tetratricopeptide (TPR) repeat protein
LLKTEGKMSEAETYLREVLEKRRRMLGEEDINTVWAMSTLGELLDEEGKLNEAEPLLRVALAKNRRIRGEDHPQTIFSIYDLGVLLEDQDKLNQAEPFMREALAKNRRVLGEEHPETLSSVSAMGKLLSLEGKYAEAIQLLAPFETAHRKAFQTDNRGRLGTFLMRLGKARLKLDEFAAAQANLLEAQPLMVNDSSVKPERKLECTQDIIDLYTAWSAKEPGKGYDAKAADWKKKLDALAAASPAPAGSKPSAKARQ